jgi:CRP-like cAMP-binding protein
MTTPVLTIEELQNIETGAWFSKLSTALKSAILARAVVRRLADGDALAARGTPAEQWCGVARGAVRISTVSLSGKQVTLTYAEPGTWFGDIALFDGLPRTHDADAHGATTLLIVRKPDFKALLEQHVELYDALLRLNCRRLRLMFDQFEDLNTRPLQARLAKQLLLLARSYGTPQGAEIRIGLALAQEDLARQSGAQGLRARRCGARRADPAGGLVAREAHGRGRTLKGRPR